MAITIGDKLRNSFQTLKSNVTTLGSKPNLRMMGSNLRSIPGQLAQNRQMFTPRNILGGNQAELGRIAMSSVKNKTARNALELSTRLPGAMVQGASFGLFNPLKDKPAQTTGGQIGDFLGNMAGFSKSPITRRLTKLTDPLALKAVNKLTPKIAPAIGGLLAPRIAASGANVVQGRVFDAAQGQNPFNPTSIGLDAVSGFALGPNSFVSGPVKSNFDLTRNKGSIAGADELSVARQSLELLNNKNLDTETFNKVVEQIDYLTRSHVDNATINKILKASRNKDLKVYYKKMVKEVLKRINQKVENGKFDITTRPYDPYDLAVPGLTDKIVMNKRPPQKTILNYVKNVGKGVADDFEIPRLLNRKRQQIDGPSMGLFGGQQARNFPNPNQYSTITPTTKTQTPQLNKQLETIQPLTKTSNRVTLIDKKLRNELEFGPQTNQTVRTLPSQDLENLNQKKSLENIIADGRKSIGKSSDQPRQSFRQIMSNLYTQWVDRYNPIVKASQAAKQNLKTKGASLRPEYDPEYLVRRLTGAGGIADQKYKTELEPIIKQLDQLKIDKLDLDTYLAHRRMAGFGNVGRNIYGVDPVKSQQIVNALEAKYGNNIKTISDQLYTYQNKGFQEMIDAGFLSPESASLIRQQNPDYSPLNRVMVQMDEYLGLPTRKTMQGTQPVSKIKGSKKQIESPLENIIGNTFKQRAAIEKNRVAQSIIGLQKIAPELGFNKVKKSGPGTITVWNNGQKEYWQVGSDIAEVAKGVNEEAMNTILKIIQAPASLLRQGATGRNPEFMLPNIIRDQLDAGITSKYGYVPFVDYTRGLWELVKKDINNKYGKNLDTSVYDSWAKSGAKIDLGELSGKKSISQLFDEKKSRKSLFSWLGSGLDVMGKYSEQPTRIGLYKKALDKTGNETLAMMESRDATVDFARMGSKMKVANSIIPFLNVGVQGFDKLIRSVKNNPGKVLLNMGVYGASPAIATTIYNLINHPEEYSEIPQYEKESNFVLIKGRNQNGTVDYVTIPKGNVLPVVANPIQSFLEYAYGNDQNSFKEMALSTMSSALPVVGDGSSVNEIAIKTIGSNIPQAIKPLAENLLNKSFYKYDPKKEQTKEIVPYYLQNKPAYQQTYKFTPQMYQKIGALVNVSPLKVQNLMEGYLAGYSKIPAQLVEMMVKYSNGDQISPNEKTLLRRFVKQTYPSSSQAAQVKPKSPGLMERLTGKVSASSASKNAQDEYAISNEKERMKIENISTSKVGNSILIKQSDGSIKTVQTDKPVMFPKLTGSQEIDKKLISKFRSELTSKENDIIELFQAGHMSQDEAEKQIKNINTIRDFLKQSSGGGGGGVTKSQVMAAYRRALKAQLGLSQPMKVQKSISSQFGESLRTRSRNFKSVI